MGFLAETLTGVVATVIGRQIYDSAPRLSAWLVRKAARRLPVAVDRERREEEWLAHLNDEPGLAGLYHATGSLMASYSMFLPFETAAIRCILWLIYLCFEIVIDYMFIKPHAMLMNSSIDAASKEEIEDALKFACELAAKRVMFQLARSQLPHMTVDRAMLWKTLLAFRTSAKC